MSVELNNTNDSVVLQATSGTCGISHYWDGTILTITSDSGTSACDLKGEKGDIGARGPQGLPGDANLTEAVEKAEAAATEAEAALSQLGTARDEAVTAAEQVKAIVAGNEAYTKAESDNRFANAIKPTITGEAAAATDAGNYPLQGLTLYGKTTQAGTPTPESPIDLVNSGDSGSIKVNVSGKNLLPSMIGGSGVVASGVTVTRNADETITLNGTATASGYIYLTTYSPSYDKGIKLPAGTYRVTNGHTGRFDGVSQNIWYRVGVYRDGKTIDGTNTFPRNLTIADGDTFESYIRLKEGETYNNLTFKPMICAEGVFMDDYEPYKDGGTLTINTPNGLPGIPVSSGGNYTDSTGQQWLCDEIDFNRGYYIQRLNTITLDGSQSLKWYSQSGMPSGGAIQLTLNSPYIAAYGVKNYAISDRFVNKNNISADYTHGVFGISTSGASVFFSIDGITNADAAKTWFTSNPTTIVYALDIPLGTELTAAEIAAYKELYSQYPNTTITTDSNAGIAATYVADTKLYIDNKFNELSTALVAMGG